MREETKEEMVRRIFHFRPMEPMEDDECFDIHEFHEWCVAYAVREFKAKTVEDNRPLSLFFMRRPGYIHVLETRTRSNAEKRGSQMMVRNILEADRGTWMVGTAMEAWVSKRKAGDKLIEPRNDPEHEDVLMVTSEHRGGPQKMTRWVVKLKHNPANNRMLARDDIDLSEERVYGVLFGLFKPMQMPPDEEE